MKKLLIVFAMFASTAVFAGPTSDAAWKFEPTIGPGIGIRGYAHQFDINLKFGKENWGGTMDWSFANGVTTKLAVVYDYPFYISLDKSDDFSVGPTADAGILIGVQNFFMAIPEIGFGARLSYQLNDNFGVVFVPIHLSMNFFSINTVDNFGFRMSYDMKFGVFLLL